MQVYVTSTLNLKPNFNIKFVTSLVEVKYSITGMILKKYHSDIMQENIGSYNNENVYNIRTCFKHLHINILSSTAT